MKLLSTQYFLWIFYKDKDRNFYYLSKICKWMLSASKIGFGFRQLYVHKRIWVFVATLALDSWPMQGLARVCAKKKAWESHLMLPGVQNNVREWTLTIPSELPFWELESWWTFESSKSDCRGQNSLDWRVLYIIGKIL